MLCTLYVLYVQSTKHKALSSVIRCGSRYHRTSVLIARRACIRVWQTAIHIASRSRIHVCSGICIRSIRVDWFACISVRLISVGVLVFVLVSWSLGSVLVAVCGRVCVSVLAGFVGCYGLRFFAFLGRTADVHGHSLTCLNDLTRPWQLEQNYVMFRLIAWPVRANTKLQISFRKDFLCLESILANNIRNLYFRTTQRQIDRGGHAEEKNTRDRNNDSDTPEDRYNSGNYTHQIAKSTQDLHDLPACKVLILSANPAILSNYIFRFGR